MEFKDSLRKYMEINEINTTELADIMGLTHQAISDFLLNDGNPRKATKEKYYEKLPGFKDFCKNYSSKDSQRQQSGPSISDRHGVPYYDVDFQGGLDMLMNNQTINPSFYIDFAPYNDCDVWINVTGKSMSPLIANGDIAALKLLRDWKIWIPPGEVYAIYTDEHRTIKIVSDGKDADHFLLKSYNESPEFVDTQIPKYMIKKMFRVKGTIKKFF